MSASAQQILVQKDRKTLQPVSVAAPKTGWKLFGWLGVLLVVVGGVDVALQWYPMAFKSPEWEFGTVSVTIASLPLLTIGTMALLASFMARAVRAGVITMTVVFTVLTLAMVFFLVLFLSDIPLALRAVPAAAALQLKKSIVRTLVMGFSFGSAYLIAAVSSFRYLSRRFTDV